MRRRHPGFTTVELLLVCALFSIVLLVAHGLLSSGIAAWQKTASSQDTLYQLAKVRSALQNELALTKLAGLSISAFAGSQNNVVWFLSAADPDTGEFARKPDGTPFWQRNHLYYLAVPTDHDQLFGVKCGDQALRCPHKFMIKRVIDHGYGTTPKSPANLEERLMSAKDALKWATRPKGYQLQFAKPYCDRDEMVATGLLEFAVTKKPARWEDEVEVHVSGFNLEEAGKRLAIGTVPLDGSPFTHHYKFTAYPGNY